MLKTFGFVLWFCLMAATGVVLGCFVHAQRVNQTTLMSGVAFVRELPYGEWIVGHTETAVFSYQEKKNLEQFMEKHGGKIQIDPEVLKRHQDLYGGGDGERQ
ncbi:MAG: hypothetical protein V2B18_00350 [Pseudomonadota bacterium]